MLNSFSGIGRLINDPEATKKPEGFIQADFTLRVTEFYKQDNDLHKRDHRIPCRAFGRLAEICLEFLTKGSQVGIRGVLRELPQNGKPEGNTKLGVTINELEFLSSNRTSVEPAM